MRLDSSGNLGLGVTPSAWASTTKAIQIGSGAAIMGSNYDAYFTSNYYFSSSTSLPTYIANGYAGQYAIASGAHKWNIAPSGTAGTNITFTTAMTLDNSGNLGLGVTPSAWGSGLKAFDINGGSLMASSSSAVISSNSYYNGSAWTYKSTGYATRYENNYGSLGIHAWYTAPSGTAGTAISFTQAMTLASTGNLLIGTTSDPGYRLAVSGLTQIRGADVQINSGQLNSTTNYIQSITNGGTTAALAFFNDTERMRIDSLGNIYGTAGTTAMTSGFFYIPSAAGAPTGTPTAVSGHVPMYYDTTNNQFYVYNGAWKKVTLA